MYSPHPATRGTAPPRDRTSVLHLRSQRHVNVLVCQTGRPWNPYDLANFWEAGVVAAAVGTFSVEHYRAQDSREAGEGFLPRWSADDEQHTDNVHVTVFHGDVDPASRVCQACGTRVGKG
jgi:hypothetical protein